MNRREVLEKMPLVLGGVVSTPFLLQLMASCKNEKESTGEQYLNKSQLFIISQICNIILPVSSTIGATDLSLSDFIDKVVKDVLTLEEQVVFIKGHNYFQVKFEKVFQKEISKGTEDDFLKLISSYFNVTREKQADIFTYLETPEDEVENKQVYYIYKYLIFVRHYTLYGYYTSEVIGKKMLEQNPITGYYESCVLFS